MAGESARDFARRQREKAERHARVADLYERGAEGESATGAVLDQLRAQGWFVMHDVRWPGRPRANIDHIAVGPGGVFVIDSKNWAGRVSVEASVLKQNGRQREAAVVGAAEAALAITAILGQMPSTGVLCFVRDEQLSGWARDVMVCTTANVVQMLTSRPPVLHLDAVARVRVQLTRALAPATGTSPAGPTRLLSPNAARRPPRRYDMPVRHAPGRSNRAKGKKGPSLKRFFVLSVVALAMVTLGSRGMVYISDAIQRATQHLVAPEHTFGQTVTVEGNTSRPGLQVSIARPVVVVANRPRQRPKAGTRLLGVAVNIRNVGDQTWSSQGMLLSLLDEEDTSYVATSRIRRIKAGPLLDYPLTLRHGADGHGYVVFEVPKTVRIAAVRMIIGPGVPATVRWRSATQPPSTTPAN
jgi:hypothetical protein